MTASDYLVDVLVQHQVTDAFGIPGGVILDLIYAIDRREGIEAHLSYHEQSAGFAAVGYAQASGKLGVAYATRGPGFTNLITPIADAYCDSVPTLFITSHVGNSLNPNVRLTNNQEIDTCAMVNGITKYAKRVDTAEEFAECVQRACHEALSGRKGPVFLDVASSVWKAEVTATIKIVEDKKTEEIDYVSVVSDAIRNAKRPVILIGDGINQTATQQDLQTFVQKCKIPVLSSRYATNILADSEYYYGYIGGFGVRYANFILSKADLIVSLGNRLNFPLTSESYHNIPYQAKIIRFDIDAGELAKEIPNAISYHKELSIVLSLFNNQESDFGNHSDWIEVCDTIQNNLWDEDVNDVVKTIDSILAKTPQNASIVSDVGNHEFWVSRACAHSRRGGNILYSKSFATLGSAMVKAIGAYYATRKPVVCFIGDQGFQMNLQELQYISQHNLPIIVVVMNNRVSGMIRDKELSGYKGLFVHSTNESGYQTPAFSKIASTYSISYCKIDTTIGQEAGIFQPPCLVNMLIDESLSLAPSLPRGHAPQDMIPTLDKNRLDYLNCL